MDEQTGDTCHTIIRPFGHIKMGKNDGLRLVVNRTVGSTSSAEGVGQDGDLTDGTGLDAVALGAASCLATSCKARKKYGKGRRKLSTLTTPQSTGMPPPSHPITTYCHNYMSGTLALYLSFTLIFYLSIS